MATIAEAVAPYRSWDGSRADGTERPFKLGCSLAPPASGEEVRTAWAGQPIPAELAELWAQCREARLFEDVDYGQWGLVLLNPTASAQRTAAERQRRPLDFLEDDIVVGEFLGDLELLVLAPSEDGERRLLVALPLDPRPDWYGVATSLADFLTRFFASSGEKYWEAQ